MDASSESDFLQSTSVTIEWTVRNLKQVFDSSKGDAKSKVIKSPRFGDGRWQILFYANAGTQKEAAASEGGGYISLFLACEPTPEEKEAALSNSGRWIRNGVYKFVFELRSLDKTYLYNSKEASNHLFSYKTSNWGWAQFARRDSVYYQSVHARAQDAFIIICTIVCSPRPMSVPAFNVPRISVPKGLVETIGSLFDDPRYSDVEFIVLRRNQDPRKARRIWAARKVLQRAEYFDDMFNNNFAEGTTNYNPLGTPRNSIQSLSNRDAASEIGVYPENYMDSDEEDDESSDHSDDGDTASQTVIYENEHAGIQDNDSGNTHFSESNADDGNQLDQSSSISKPQSDSASVASVPFATPVQSPNDEVATNEVRSAYSSKPHSTVLIRDVAYNTYRAILYYLYTDSIVFAPLSSSFTFSRRRPSDITPATQSSAPADSTTSSSKKGIGPNIESFSSRKDWIKEWMKSNPGRPTPCSAKAVYREADRLDLKSLKERAATHIIKSLTVDNIAYEVFSPFSATFEEIRKVEIDFFLRHWQEIRSSESMKTVWRQIRSGKHPGFEEVWPAIAANLEFRPTTATSSEIARSDSLDT